MRKGYIYLITNEINLKKYVGKTAYNIEKRFKEHIYYANKGCKYALHKAIRKYGVENFSVREIACVDANLLNDLEKHYIKLFGTFSPTGHGYNCTHGGEGVLGWKPDAAYLKNASERRKGRRDSPETIEKKRQAQLGHPVSEKTRQALAERNKGNKYGLGKTPWNKGLSVTIGPPPSEETKQKLRIAQLAFQKRKRESADGLSIN